MDRANQMQWKAEQKKESKMMKVSAHGFERGGVEVLPAGEGSTARLALPSTLSPEGAPESFGFFGASISCSLSPPWTVELAKLSGFLFLDGEPGGVGSFPWWNITSVSSCASSYKKATSRHCRERE